MNEQTLRELLAGVRTGSCSIDDALVRLRALPFEDLGFAKVDHHRSLRCGFPEVVYAEGKTAEQVGQVVDASIARGVNVLVTRASPDVFERVSAHHSIAKYNSSARAITLRVQDAVPSDGTIVVAAAGTSDIPVAEEAVTTAEIMDQRVTTMYDVGVAGIHRLFAEAQRLQDANVIIAVAGMDGALPSVVGGIVSAPVIAVPTSVGYGASFHGLAALLTMLNCCAAGVAVVNIDNGFGAGYLAALINKRSSIPKRSSTADPAC